MSQDASLHETQATAEPELSFKPAASTATIIAVVGVIACAGAFFGGMGTTMLQSWMYGWSFWITVTMGCFGLVLLHHTVRGSWGLAGLRLWEAGGSAQTLGVMFVAFFPILLNLKTFYPWADPLKVAGDHLLHYKAPYLNPTQFGIRTVIYFVIWAYLASTLRKSSVSQDTSQDPRETAKRTSVSAPCIVLYVLTLTLAITDWVMSMDAHWFSSIYGIWFMVNGGLATLGLTAMIVSKYRKVAPYNSIISKSLTKDIGNMMFVFTLLWTYFTLSQFIITWSGNLPEFISYYTTRREGAWNILGAANLIIGFFFVFMFLLAPRTKATPDLLMKVGILAFLVRITDIYWNVIPYMRGTFAWTDILAFVTVGAIWVAVMANQTLKASLYPRHDMRLVEAQHSHA